MHPLTRRHGSLLVGAIFVAATLAAPASAQFGDESVAVYGTRHAPAELYQVDLDTGLATLATKLSATMVAAAMRPHTGEIYVVDNGGINPLYKWDPVTDTETLVTPGESMQWHRFGFDACGRLWGVVLNSRTLYEVDPETGSATFFGGMTNVSTGGSTGDLAFAPGDKYGFYYAVGTSLYYVPFHNLAAQYIGETKSGSTHLEIAGLAFQPDGRLFGTNKYELYEISRNNGNCTFIGSHGTSKLNDLSSGNAHVVLWPDKPAYSPNDPITLTTFKSEPGGIAGLALTKIDGADFFQFILFGRYDGAGNWVLNSTVPPSLSGLDMSFRSFGNLPTTGRLVRSPEITLSFL